MSKYPTSGMTRRRFLQVTGLATAGAALASSFKFPVGKEERVFFIVDPEDKVASSASWALDRLRASLQKKGISSTIVQQLSESQSQARCVLVSSSTGELARDILRARRISVSEKAESLGILEGEAGNRSVLLVCGSDRAGLTYGLLELTDRAQHASRPLSSLAQPMPIKEEPANPVRSIYRPFTSEIEDKPWFYNRELWQEYLTMLATQRFNRFNLAFGMGYNTASHVLDSYFLFPYPFLLSVPGYDVRMGNLPAAERDKNLEMLKFISEETAARGIQFQLGIWSLGRDWPDSPNVNYPLLGVTKENHAPYCRDALTILLKECPSISGITFRVHGESGVPEGDFSFWETQFEAFARCGRTVRLDMHSKNVPQKMIDVAVSTGMPVTISPKYWGEQMGVGYVPASIRPHEMPKEPYVEQPNGVSLGSRGFTRYSYGDFFWEGRPYGVMHRFWPGTQRFLVYGDPVLTAGFGRASSFCDGLGFEILDPLTFKGRQGSGHPGGRCAYSEKSLEPEFDFEKYLYTYRTWGRLAFNPDCDPDVWQRALKAEFPRAAKGLEKSLSAAGRVLALVSTYHAPSTDSQAFWAEIYTDIPIVEPLKESIYWDSENPRVFGHASPLDPQLFARIDEYTDAVMTGATLQKYTPIEVAEKLEELAADASQNIADARSAISDKHDPSFRRIEIDVTIQSDLARYFASKIRAAMLWQIYKESGETSALKFAVAKYRLARDAWKEIAEGAGKNYVSDISYGERPNLRGHWSDRFPEIENDFNAMENALAGAGSRPNGDPERIRQAIQIALSHPRHEMATCDHVPPESFRRGEPFQIEVTVPSGTRKVDLFYRHVNQALVWQTAPMTGEGKEFRASIPAEYTRTHFRMQYYFALHTESGFAIFPGLDENFMNQPYFVVKGVQG